jgi:hypothetical protein
MLQRINHYMWKGSIGMRYTLWRTVKKASCNSVSVVVFIHYCGYIMTGHWFVMDAITFIFLKLPDIVKKMSEVVLSPPAPTFF